MIPRYIDLTELGVEQKLRAEAIQRYHSDPTFHAKVHRVRHVMWLLDEMFDEDMVMEVAALTLTLEDLELSYYKAN